MDDDLKATTEGDPARIGEMMTHTNRAEPLNISILPTATTQSSY